MKKRGRKIIACLLAASISLSCAACSSEKKTKVKLDPNQPVKLEIWHYYNGIQQQIFDKLVEEFNQTAGADEGIVVEAHSKGSVSELTDSLIASANEEVGSDPLPDVYSTYSDTAYLLDQKGEVANLSEYLTEDELSEYMDSYIQEGYLNKEGELKIFPVAKSTEILLVNETDWQPFEDATGADKSELATWEGIVDIAKKYYEWTDAKTPDVPNDGKAFFGRDAVANYMLIGSLQLGTEMFQVQDGKMTLQIDDDVMKRLWDCYYVPFVNGWFGAYGRFRSDDIKTGQLIALVGSTSGAAYFPSEVTCDDGSTYPIECGVYSLPNFEDTDPYAVQQGAGFVVTKSSEEKEYAATVFLKWFTQTDNNVEFSLNSGYLPVKKEANDMKVLESAVKEMDVSELAKNTIEVGVEVTSNYTLYTNRAFENGYSARQVLENSISDAAKDALVQRDQMIAEGMDRDEAINQLTSDEMFEQWLSSFKEDLNTALEK